MSLLSFSKVSKSFLTNPIFSEISFLIDDKDKIGLIGNNGSGKSTLLKTIIGEIEIDEGQINKEKDLKIGYLEQIPNFDSDDSILDICLRVFDDVIKMENDLSILSQEIAKAKGQELEDLMKRYASLLERFEESNGYGYNSYVRGVLIGLGFSEEEFNLKVSALSGGQKSRLHLASLLLKDPDLLLLDEPTNHLDMEATRFLETFLKNYNGAVLIVSHDRYFLDRVINRTFNIENKKLYVYNCNYTNFVRRHKEMLAAMEKKYEKQQNEIKKQEEIIERFSNYGRDRYKKQAESRRKQLEKIELVDKPMEDSSEFNLRFTPIVQSGMDVLSYENISKSFDGKKIIENINFDIKRNDRVGIIGANGIGKTTLIKMATGEVNPDSGEVFVGSNVQMAYYDQEQDNLYENNMVIDEILDAKAGMTISIARNYLGAFNFKGDDVYKIVGDLSGGEMGRLSLLKLMLQSPNLLLMDEPTNHLDIESKEVLEQALLDYDGTFIVVSHDRYFLNKVVNKIILVERDKATIFHGDYDYYIDKISFEEETEKDTISKTSIKKEQKKIKQSQKELRKLRSDLNSTEREISSLEEEIDELKKKSYDPQIYNDYEKAHQLHEEIDKKTLKVEQLTNKWFSISEELEGES